MQSNIRGPGQELVQGTGDPAHMIGSHSLFVRPPICQRSLDSNQNKNEEILSQIMHSLLVELIWQL